MIDRLDLALFVLGFLEQAGVAKKAIILAQINDQTAKKLEAQIMISDLERKLQSMNERNAT